MSLINARKRRGLRTVPCGTPDNTSASEDFVPSNKTDCFLWLPSSVEWSIERHSSSTCVAGDDEALCQMPWKIKKDNIYMYLAFPCHVSRNLLYS